jgi:hypothetical protein
MEATILTFEQMKESYPNQWLLVLNTKTAKNLDLIEGEVIAHAPDRDTIYDTIARERKTRTGTLSIEYTGPIPDDLAFIL